MGFRSSRIGVVMVLLMVFLSASGGIGATGSVQAAESDGDKSAVRASAAELPSASADASPTAMCPATAPVKAYDIQAINVEITINRWGEWVPEGKMYVPSDRVPAVRAKEASNRLGRLNNLPGPEQGLEDDPIQPLVLRANIGDCVEIRFTNTLNEPASMHIQGANQVLKDTGEAATAANPNAIPRPGAAVSYQWYVDPAVNQERTLQIRPAANMRTLNDFGLFGALVVEPAGSQYLHNSNGSSLCKEQSANVTTCASDWRAMISPGTGSDFRENLIFYHEFGNDTYRPLDRFGEKLPLIGPLTGSYGVGRFAINYRSEPHETRLQSQVDNGLQPDESMAYSSYAFGDPAMPIPRGYVGDPTKLRVVHGSGEVFHVHHLHGGGIRWPKQPLVPDANAASDSGLRKSFPELPASLTLDTQAVGPAESYDTVPYCGAGGCQQGAGDYVFHCHVGHHYVSGMWTFWRVYNTLRVADEPNPTDRLGALAELPDRAGRMKQAVSTDKLIGTTVLLGDQPTVVTAQNLPSVVERMLPPQGKPVGYDASVFDWIRQDNVYLNEPEETRTWVHFKPINPGQRQPIQFDPVTGKLAYPFLQPHFSKRPPFAPGHGPAAYLDPSNDADLPAPGANGPSSLCPTGAPRRFFDISAESTPVQITKNGQQIDGLLYMNREEKAAILSGQKKKEPLVIRGNQTECVDVTLVNHVPDAALGGFSKINLHQHFVQFDIQSTDGVVVGANWETSIRSYTDTGKAIAGVVSEGATSITVADTEGLHPGSLVMVGIDNDQTHEIAKVLSVAENVISFAKPLKNVHAVGELVSPEFIRSRWYLDMQFGSVFWHDHVKGLETWPRGLVGLLIVEPPNSTYHDPQTGQEVNSGTLVDIRTIGKESYQMLGSFREAAALIFDAMLGTGSGVNLRSEPMMDRNKTPALAFSSVMHGDPYTMIPRAYAGDHVVFRMITTSAARVNTFRLMGHYFSQEPYAPEELEYRDTIAMGISDRESAFLKSAGGSAKMPGDYLWTVGDQTQVEEGGAWGIFRVHDTHQPDLQPLPDRPLPLGGRGFPQLTATGGAPPKATSAVSPCPTGAPDRQFEVSAINMEIQLNEETKISDGAMYVLDEDIQAVQSGAKPPEPLAIRANEGDCVVINFTNRLTDSPASVSVGTLLADPQSSQGITVGFNPDQTVEMGQSTTYRVYAEHQPTTALIRDYGNVFKNPQRGLYGALIVEPKGSTYLDPSTGTPLASGNEAIIANPDMPDFREFVVQMHDEDADFGFHVMPYRDELQNDVAINYRSEPLEKRLSTSSDASLLFSSAAHGDPVTPVFKAVAGDRVRFRVLHNFGEQASVFAVEGHQWQMMPGQEGSQHLYARRVGTTETLEAELLGGAGGTARIPGDYLYLNQRLAWLEAGQWGLMRVFATLPDGLAKLPDR